MIDLRDVDLNLLVVFNELRVEGRVWKVAERLGLTPPSVSNALARLRRLFDDKLFIATPTGMKPTPFAEQIADSVATALGLLHSAVNEKAAFDPGTSQRRFTIGMTDIGEIYFLPRLMAALRSAAPSITISTARNAAVNLADAMEAGQIDIAIGFLPQLKAGYHQRLLFRQRYVCLMRKDHPLDKKRISLAEFSAAEHLAVIAAGTGHHLVDDELQRSGISRNVRLTVPHFVSVAHTLLSTDMIATVPERLAQSLVAIHDLTYVRHPAALSETAIALLWHAKFHRDPANKWLRSVLFALFAP